MKKIIACMSLVFALSAGATALADGRDVTSAYNKDGNSLSVSGVGATDKNTVLVTKNGVDGSAGIVFVDQNDSTFDTTTSLFLLKGDTLTSGTYTVKMNNAAGDDLTTNTFTISDEPLTEVVLDTEEFRYTKTGANGKNVYDTGFIAKNANVSNITNIAITVVSGENEGKTLYYPLGTTVTNTTANFAIRINDIPADTTISVKLVGDTQSSSSENE